MKAVKVPVQICGLISIVSEVEKHVPEPYALRNGTGWSWFHHRIGRRLSWRD